MPSCSMRNRAFEEKYSSQAQTTVRNLEADLCRRNGEGFVSNTTHKTVALAFSLTEEAMEDNIR